MNENVSLFWLFVCRVWKIAWVSEGTAKRPFPFLYDRREPRSGQLGMLKKQYHMLNGNLRQFIWKVYTVLWWDSPTACFSAYEQSFRAAAVHLHPFSKQNIFAREQKEKPAIYPYYPVVRCLAAEYFDSRTPACSRFTIPMCRRRLLLP